MFEKCDLCKTAREEERFDAAVGCRQCGGIGFVPTADECMCNRCGVSLHPKKETMNAQIPHGLPNLEVVGGYDSEGLIDLHRYQFSLCERCIRDILSKSKIPPKVDTMTDGGQRWQPVSFSEDQTMWEYSEWRRNGGHATARIHRLCNAIKGCEGEALYSVQYSEYVSDDCACEIHKNQWKNCINAKVIPFVSWQESRKEKVKIDPLELEASYTRDYLLSMSEERRLLFIAKVTDQICPLCGHLKSAQICLCSSKV